MEVSSATTSYRSDLRNSFSAKAQSLPPLHERTTGVFIDSAPHRVLGQARRAETVVEGSIEPFQHCRAQPDLFAPTAAHRALEAFLTSRTLLDPHKLFAATRFTVGT